MHQIFCKQKKLNEDDRAVAMHSDDSEDDVIVIDYKPSSLKQSEELGSNLEFYFRYSGPVDEVINIKFFEKLCLLKMTFLSNNKKGTEKEFYYNHVVNGHIFQIFNTCID